MTKPFYEAQDIMKIMQCGRNKAYEYIRAIKSISDVGETAGRVMVRDFNLWAYGTPEGVVSSGIKELKNTKED